MEKQAEDYQPKPKESGEKGQDYEKYKASGGILSQGEYRYVIERAANGNGHPESLSPGHQNLSKNDSTAPDFVADKTEKAGEPKLLLPEVTSADAPAIPGVQEEGNLDQTGTGDAVETVGETDPVEDIPEIEQPPTNAPVEEIKEPDPIKEPEDVPVDEPAPEEEIL